MQLKRCDGLEVPIAIAEVMQETHKHKYQARILWFGSGHLREYNTRELELKDIKVDAFVLWMTIQNAGDQLLGMSQ